MDADMPCNVTPPNPKDRVNMVLWFKDSEGVPLYSLDNRNGDLEKAEHGAIARPKTGKGRYFFQTSASGVPLPPSGPRASPHNWEQPDEGVTLEPKVARLRILNVSAEDEGVFRCRVDFLDSPTTNFRVKLTLATPPSAPVIYNKNGVEVGALAGPFQEGYDLQLSCSVTNGHPRPVVTWWLGDTLLDDMVETKTSSETINRLTLPAVTREHLGAVLQCRAAPLPGAPYQHRDVTLDVYLKPKRVQIMTALETLPAGRPRQVQCETSGSVPAAQVTWLLDGEALRNDAVTVTDDRHVTISTVTLVATPKDDGRELACRAENPRVPGGFMEDRRKIRVAHAPEVTISLASEKSADQLMEGDEVRLRCDVRANPPPDKVSWYHGNHLLRQDSEPQPSHPGRRLYVVRDLGPSSAGEYSCAASNREGTGRSDPVSISVQYSPRCRQGFDNRRVGALKGTPVQVRCEVLAEPADVRFSWTFNRSKDGSVAVPAHKVETNGTVSYLAYTPNGDNDFGTLGCWASNSVGRILVPCYVHVVAASEYPTTPLKII
ncbi:hypothetical protein ONE63_009347 [Megalurothrips usitatus]|uniref:Ig-like domain-containing protein n=1 Tax=Megalurothrips usitatus TaxID=439358 RepID=A0AAV7XLX7_9NEOP|nr:hypothetical protein ONE63_009347 [Megalurothrips usitatus]